MSDRQVSILIHRMDGQFYTNVTTPHGDFICTLAQQTMDMSLASAMEFIRDQFESHPDDEQPLKLSGTFHYPEDDEKDEFEVTQCPICGETHPNNAWLQEHMTEEGHIV